MIIKIIIMVLILLTLTISITGEDVVGSNKKIISTEYKASTKKTTYDDNTINLILYSGTKFANDKGLLIENAPSLKDCQFCGGIILDIQEDKKYPVTVIDYNYTSITLDVKSDSSELNKNIPLKVYTKGNESDVKYETTSKLTSVSDKNNYVLLFGFDKEVKWGVNSTTIKLNDTSGEIKADLTIDQSGVNQGFQVRVNITSVPTNVDINDSTFCVYWEQVDGTIDNDATINRIKDQNS